MFEKYFREERIDNKYKTYKAHLLLVFRYTVRSAAPRLTRSKALESWCDKLLANLREPEFWQTSGVVLEIFDKAFQLWMDEAAADTGSRISKNSLSYWLEKRSGTLLALKSQEPRMMLAIRMGEKILRLVWREGYWFGFITRGVQYENLYFEGRSYRDEPRELVPDQRVRFGIGKSSKGLFAKNVSLVQ